MHYKNSKLGEYIMNENQKVRNNSFECWNNLYSEYKKEDIIVDNWLDRFDSIINKCTTPILDLGCGSGNDTL